MKPRFERIFNNGMKKIRIGFFGLAHPHSGALLNTVLDNAELFDIVGFAEVPLPPRDPATYEKRRARFIEKGISEYVDYKELVSQNLELAIVNTDNGSRADVCCELLEAGINVLGEKPMAADYSGAERMYHIAKEKGVFMLTNWPIAWFPPFRLAKKLLDEGRIGKLMRVTYRSPATWGPFSGVANEGDADSWWLKAEQGGGSILDYACYGAMLSTFMFGKPAERVCGISKQFATAFCDVEDYSAMILDFGDGVGLLEGSWSTYNCGEVPSGPVLHGTKGTIVCDRYSTKLKIYEGLSHAPVPPVEVIDAGDSVQDKMLASHIAKVLRGEEEPDEMLRAEINVAVVAALDAGRRSAQTGVYEELSKPPDNNYR